MQPKRKSLSISGYLRALRLPFTTASAFAFIAGSLIAKGDFHWVRFLFGLLCAVATHLGANLFNDFADAKSGADSKDLTFYGFFGGSKLIQEGVLSLAFYRNLACTFFLIAGICVVGLEVLLKDRAILGYYLFIAALGFSYSHKPLQLSYRRLGELTIFILFGPAIVMGAYYIQTGIVWSMQSFMLSLPFGIFTALILFANEIPDYEVDAASKKFTLINVVGKDNALLFYWVFIVLGFLGIGAAMVLGYLSVFSLISLLALIPTTKAVAVLKKHTNDKKRLMQSSQLTIAVHTIVSISILVGILL